MIRTRARKAREDKRGLLIVSSGGIGDTILFSLMIERFMSLVPDGEDVTLVVRSESQIVHFLFSERVHMMPVDYRKFIRSPLYRFSVSKKICDLGVRTAISTDHLRLPTVDDVMIMASGAAARYALTPRSWPKHDAALMRHREWYTNWIEPEPAMAHRLIRWWELARGLTKDDTPPPKVTFAQSDCQPRLRAKGHISFCIRFRQLLSVKPPPTSSLQSQKRSARRMTLYCPRARTTWLGHRNIRRWLTCLR